MSARILANNPTNSFDFLSRMRPSTNLSSPMLQPSRPNDSCGKRGSDTPAGENLDRRAKAFRRAIHTIRSIHDTDSARTRWGPCSAERVKARVAPGLQCFSGSDVSRCQSPPDTLVSGPSASLRFRARLRRPARRRRSLRRPGSRHRSSRGLLRIFRWRHRLWALVVRIRDVYRHRRWFILGFARLWLLCLLGRLGRRRLRLRTLRRRRSLLLRRGRLDACEARKGSEHENNDGDQVLHELWTVTVRSRLRQAMIPDSCHASGLLPSTVRRSSRLMRTRKRCRRRPGQFAS